MPVVSPQTISLCIFTDNKAGHRTQLQGLVYGIGQYSAVTEHWLKTDVGFSACLTQLRQLPKNSLVLGAGGATWRYLVIAKKVFGLPTVVLMRPRLWPLRWFDLVVAPKHDGLHDGAGIICTEGVLSPVLPARSPDPLVGLILIGGPSKHHDWDADALFEQINKILDIDKGRRWRLTTSRRTPINFISQLRTLQSDQLEIHPVNETPPSWVRDRLSDSSVVWVTEDSMSMVFEGLSAGIEVGLLPMPRRRSGRVTACIDDLIARRLLTSFNDYVDQKKLNGARPPLQEAVRVGKVIVARWNEKFRVNG